ncbi:MAG: hypothetical protein AAGI44_16795, partial [Pseudomonadota bacterium]
PSLGVSPGSLAFSSSDTSVDRAAPTANVNVYNIDVADSNINVRTIYIYGKSFLLDQGKGETEDVYLRLSVVNL